MADSLDLVNRDPNNINDHLKEVGYMPAATSVASAFWVSFEDVLAEPEGAHSIDCVWKLSYTCFTCWLGLCYKLSTLFYGICIAAEWGCEFAQVAFYHVWYITPALKLCQIECAVWTKIMRTFTACCCEPCCEACAALFIHLKK